MARECRSRSEKLGLVKDQSESPYANCKFKIEYPTIHDSQTAFRQNIRNGSKLGFQCHREERMKRAESGRNKMIEKLKKNYKIDVEGLNEHVTREILIKIRELDKEKRQREKRNVEKTITMLTRLIEEQKYKHRGGKVYKPTWRKRNLAVSKSGGENTRKESGSEMKAQCAVLREKDKSEEILSEENLTDKSSDLRPIESIKSVIEEEKTRELPRCVDVKNAQDVAVVSRFENIVRKPRSPCMSVEYCLESVPKRVVFTDYKKNKVYLQDLRITNIGKETIHCRYLGIVVHDKTEEKFPVGVAVRDNVKLRPGLYCSTKIRLCSQDDTKKLQCTIVYETRREKNFLQHSWFFVPVICIPVQAIVRVFPLKITFPSLTWCEAMSPKGKKLLIKTLKIENSGGKACSCKISTKKSTRICLMEHAGEAEGEAPYVNEAEGETEYTNNSESSNSWHRLPTNEEEFEGEDYNPSDADAERTATKLLNELFEFVFATFHFSKIHHIEIPPFSTVQIQVRFSPQYKGFHHEVYSVLFEDSDNLSEQIVELNANIKSMPVKAEPRVIDLKTCIAGSGVYAGRFTLYNESRGPYAVLLKIPPVLKNHAHVFPRATTIQSRSSSDFSVRFYPRVSITKDASRYYNENSQVLEFPVFIHPGNADACKKDCIKIYVFALITNYHLELSPSFINFGTVTTLETVRTELVLTNHSLALQEFGFLNLPKGVRIEPNMGFGEILPKESIKLYLLYSPVEDLWGNEDDEGDKTEHEFQVVVTSIAKHGGFNEKMEFDEESASETVELIWGERSNYEFSPGDEDSHPDSPLPPCLPSEVSECDLCEEESSIEGEESCSKIIQEENKIREFLRQDAPNVPEHAKKMTAETPESKTSDTLAKNFPEYGEMEESKDFRGIRGPKSTAHIVNCRAVVVKPHCRLSETVILLPATSCSSFSLYRFRLKCLKRQVNINCSCGYRKMTKCEEKKRKQSRFEFQYHCPNIKLEPQAGFIQPGQSLPIRIIHRPEFPAEQLQAESKPNKPNKLHEAKTEKELQPRSKPSKSKVSPGNKPQQATSKPSTVDLETHNDDPSTGEKNLAKSMTPFCVEAKIRCVITTKSCDEQDEETELHDMIAICPAIKPKFIYLGESQEIKFNKVFVGRRSRVILQLQNISFERISPSATLLNPSGPFYTPAGIRRIEVDPEHIWRQPLTYAPLEQKGIEKQFLELHYGPTNIQLAVSGEGVLPDFRISPDLGCAVLEAKPGQSEEMKLEMENHSTISLNIYIETEFVREGPESDEWKQPEEEETKPRKETAAGPKEDRKKSKNSGKESWKVWKEIPETLLTRLGKFQDVADDKWEVFTLTGVEDGNEIQIQPNGSVQVKIQFKPPDDRSEGSYAVKYTFKLERVSPLKEVVVFGEISRGNEKTQTKP